MQKFTEILPLLLSGNGADDTSRRIALRALVNKRLTESESAIIETQMVELSQVVAAKLGEMIDGTTGTDGLRFKALPYLLGSLVNNLEAIAELAEMTLVGIPITTPGCSCRGCANLARFQQAMQETADLL